MKIIVPVIIGAIIGYFTNWLAIRMLFKPYEEKYILGFKLPFTPGLIPKEQDRIALNIGETVEKYLLSPEAIIKFVDEDALREKAKKSIGRYLLDLENEDYRVRDIIENKMGMEPGLLEEKIALALRDKILGGIRGGDLKNFLSNGLDKNLNDKRIKDDFMDLLKSHVRTFIGHEDFSHVLENFLREKEKNILEDSRKLKDIVPEKLRDEIFAYLDENKRLIGYRVRTFISSPSTEGKLKLAISNMVDKNVSKLITAFVPKETISDKIYLAIENYIKSDDANEDINGLIKSIIDDGLNKKLEDLGGDLFENIGRLNIGENLTSFIQDKFENDDIFRFLEIGLDRVDKDRVRDIIMGNLTGFLNSTELEGLVEKWTYSLVDRLTNLRINYILRLFSMDEDTIFHILEGIFNRNIKLKLPGFIGTLNIGNIVESTIKEFEFDFIEKLILDIADKELKAITRLGGILGGVIGLLTPLLQIF